jgi:hypothetical protein
MAAAAIAAIGVGIAGYGAYQSSSSASQSNALQAQSVAIQQEQLALQKKSMELDARRRRRDIIRQNVAARSAALATTVAQGAQFGSALPGAYGGIEGRTGTNLLGIDQNLEIGRDMFGLKSRGAEVSGQIANANSNAASGAAMTSLGGALVTNSGQIAKIGTYFTSGS